MGRVLALLQNCGYISKNVIRHVLKFEFDISLDPELENPPGLNCCEGMLVVLFNSWRCNPADRLSWE